MWISRPDASLCSSVSASPTILCIFRIQLAEEYQRKILWNYLYGIQMPFSTSSQSFHYICPVNEGAMLKTLLGKSIPLRIIYNIVQTVAFPVFRIENWKRGK